MNIINVVYLSKQRGFFAPIAFGMILVFSTVTWLFTEQQIQRFKDDAADQSGVYAAQFKHALQSKLTQDGAGITTGTFTGTAWLKDSATCTGGTSSLQHLPCAFPDSLNFGLSYSTVVTVSGGIATLTTSLGAPTYRGEASPSIAGRIVSAINGANSAFSTPITQAYFVATSDATTGAITITVTSSANLDYLHPNGSVLPTGDFNWNGNDITNIADLSATGTISSGSTITSPAVTATGSITTPIIFDANNPTFRVDPSGTSINETQRNNTTETTSLIMRSAVSVGGACSGRQINVDASGNVVSCVGGVWTTPGGSEIFTRSLGGNFGSGYTYSHTSSETPISLHVSLRTYGGGNREGGVQVRWLTAGGALARNWTRISATNEGNGNDGGSGMFDRELAVIPFVPGSHRIQFANTGSWGFSGSLVGVVYKR